MPVIAGNYIVAYANSAGFVNEDLYVATEIAYAESGGNTDYHFTGPETDQRGLWAINAWDHPEFDKTKLYDPTYNAWCARQIFLHSGNSWYAWQSYLDQTFVDYLPQAEAAINAFMGYGGDPTTTNAPPVSSSPPPVTSGAGTNFGPFDPAPFIRHLGDIFHSWAVGIADAVAGINRMIQ